MLVVLGADGDDDDNNDEIDDDIDDQPHHDDDHHHHHHHHDYDDSVVRWLHVAALDNRAISSNPTAAAPSFPARAAARTKDRS